MSGIRHKNTLPEMLVRQFLHRHGFRFRLHRRDLAGKPDIVLPRHSLCIFVHGCFWHRHSGCRLASKPKTREAFWEAKFEQNTSRDRRNILELENAGWRIAIIWECGLRLHGSNGIKWLPEWINSLANFVEWPIASDTYIKSRSDK